MVLAKRYMVETVLTTTVQAVTGRLQNAWEHDDTHAFVQVFAAAIKHDIGGLRWSALRLAQDQFPSVRAMYDAGSLPPEVRHEFAGIWSLPVSKVKRARLV
mmetsp:Transcript_103448/g.221197  ORF Transcript_103448/g.221197 Transcript_103448/m.221197 type:complete len:101 (+) Transcript_103448:2-304(+)